MKYVGGKATTYRIKSRLLSIECLKLNLITIKGYVLKRFTDPVLMPIETAHV